MLEPNGELEVFPFVDGTAEKEQASARKYNDVCEYMGESC